MRARLEAAGQGHLADAVERLEGPARERLEAEIAALDLDLVARLVAGLVEGEAGVHGEISPPDPSALVALPRDDADRAGLWIYLDLADVAAVGEAHLR